MQIMANFDPLLPIGDNVYLLEPGQPTGTKQPALIALCTWLGGATPSRIQKYIDGYRSLYPNSAILLITTRILEISALPFSVLHSRLAPARDAIRRILGLEGDRSRSMLLHIFSHGGCNTAIQLALSLSKDDDCLNLATCLRGIIFDCCPGGAGFGPAYQAAAHSLPPSHPALAKGVEKFLLYPAVGLITGLQWMGWMSSIQNLRSQLNGPAVFGSTAQRLYLYSTADQMVSWEDVESHMAEARARTLGSVEGLAFPRSPHCALVRDNADRYWDAIQRFWASSVLSDRVRSRI